MALSTSGPAPPFSPSDMEGMPSADIDPKTATELESALVKWMFWKLHD